MQLPFWNREEVTTQGATESQWRDACSNESGSGKNNLMGVNAGDKRKASLDKVILAETWIINWNLYLRNEVSAFSTEEILCNLGQKPMEGQMLT